MITEEMLQLLLNKVDSNHSETKVDIAKIEANQLRLEAKIDANHTEVIDKLFALKLPILSSS